MLKNYTSIVQISNLLIGIVTICPSCTPWHMAQSVTDSEPKQICIPYVQNDETGELTSDLVKAINDQPGFRVNDGGRYLLSVKLLNTKDSKLGFRYDPRKLKKGKRDLILNETRAKALVEVSVIDRFTNEVVRGPGYILGSAEYDHQESSIDSDINRFSLGNLSDIDTTEDVVHIPLYRDVANKIGIWLQNNYDFVQKPTSTETSSIPKQIETQV
jgi:hypothetical protein